MRGTLWPGLLTADTYMSGTVCGWVVKAHKLPQIKRLYLNKTGFRHQNLCDTTSSLLQVLSLLILQNLK